MHYWITLTLCLQWNLENIWHIYLSLWIAINISLHANPFTLQLVLHDLWHFVQSLSRALWAKIARRCRTLLPLAGVGNTQPGEEKTLCHLFSEDPFILQTVTVDLTLYCIALHCGKRRKRIIIYSYLPYSFVFLIRQVRLHYQGLEDPTKLYSLINNIIVNLCVLCDI